LPPPLTPEQQNNPLEKALFNMIREHRDKFLESQQ
jgi:hypothetical protein